MELLPWRPALPRGPVLVSVQRNLPGSQSLSPPPELKIKPCNWSWLEYKEICKHKCKGSLGAHAFGYFWRDKNWFFFKNYTMKTVKWQALWWNRGLLRIPKEVTGHHQGPGEAQGGGRGAAPHAGWQGGPSLHATSLWPRWLGQLDLHNFGLRGDIPKEWISDGFILEMP